MKLTLMSCLLLLSVMSIAADTDKFMEAKAKSLAHIDAQMKLLESTKKCIEGATDREAVKRCHDSAHAERTKMEKQKIDEDIKRLEEKKKQLEERK